MTRKVLDSKHGQVKVKNLNSGYAACKVDISLELKRKKRPLQF